MMRISTNSGLYSARAGKERYTMLETIRFCSEIGFDVVDINFCASIYKDPYTIDRTILRDDWRSEVCRIAEEAQKRNISFPTTHLPYYNYASNACEDMEFRAQMMERSIEAAAMLGVKWAVIHPGNAVEDPSFEKSKVSTVEYIMPYLEMAEKSGMGIAVENMPGFANGQPVVRYCTDAETLCDLVDTLGAGAGICWDFGHGNLSKSNQEESLRKVGKRLKMTHVHDNNGLSDAHLAPYMGKIQWEPLMRALREIEYTGDFNFEVTTTNIPDNLRKEHAEYLIAAGRQLVSLFDR